MTGICILLLGWAVYDGCVKISESVGRMADEMKRQNDGDAL